MFFVAFFIEVKKHAFYVFYLQCNVFNIYSLNHGALKMHQEKTQERTLKDEITGIKFELLRAEKIRTCIF